MVVLLVLMKHIVQIAVVAVLRKSLKSIQLLLHLSSIPNKSEKSSGILLILDGLDLTHQHAELLVFQKHRHQPKFF